MALSPHEFLRQQGATFVVFHPCSEQLVLGLGLQEQPAVVPHCLAFRRKGGAGDSAHSNSPEPPHPAWPHQQAYEALLQVHKLLYLPAPPRPAAFNLQQQQQQSQQQLPQQPQQPQQTDAFPAAKAGLISSREVPEGSDGFVWVDTNPPKQQQQQQLEGQKEPAGTPSAQDGLPCLAGGQVAALWPSEPYDAIWLMTPDNHIAGMDSLPQHTLLDRFEAVWGWALSRLGLPPARRRHLSAVLAVPIDMTAAEIRLFADLLLGRLGFAALVTHLEPVAATFGNGTTSACVVSIGGSSSSVCCVDDAVVLPPPKSRITLPVGLAEVGAALTGWMACYGHWPQQLQEQGLGYLSNGSSGGSSSSKGGGSSSAAEAGSSNLGAGAAPDQQQPQQPQQPGPALPAAAATTAGAVDSSKEGGSGGSAVSGSRGSSSSALSSWQVYSMLLLEDLVLQQCYFCKENYQPGLLGQPMLEEQPPAVVPVRTRGRPTTNLTMSLGTWAAVASMALFCPGLAPPNKALAAAAAPAPAAAPAVPAQVTLGTSQQPAAAAAGGDPAGRLYQRCHAAVLDLPAAEAMHLQGQLRARLEAGDASAPPVGMYLLPLELQEPPVLPGMAAPEGAAGAAPGAAGAAAAAGGGGGGGARSISMDDELAAIGLDEAVFGSIMATACGRPDLFARLAAGLLLVGPGGGLRGLGSMLERRLGQKLAAAGHAQVVSALEPRADPAHLVWKGAALLAALDSGRENWLLRHQWVAGDMPPQPARPAGKVGAGTGAGAAASGGTASAAMAGRHTKLFYYCRAEQGML